MKIAVLLLAHHRPQQLLRLVNRLRHPQIDCWIHIDKRIHAAPFDPVFRRSGVYPVPARVAATWGSFGSVKAMTNCLRAAYTSGMAYDHYQFMSGSDYLLQPPAAFVEFLAAHGGLEFIGHRPLLENAENPLRISRYYFPAFPTAVRYLLEGGMNRVFPKRTLPSGLEIRKGSQWMNLTAAAVGYLLSFIDATKSYSRFFSFVLVPDEFYFQTILYNSRFRQSMRNQIFHYIDWSNQGKSPKILTIKDRDLLNNTHLFFARKFDVMVDTDILDYLDNRLGDDH